MAANYAQQAESIYTPQMQGEQGMLDSENAATQAAFGMENSTAQSAYTGALETAGKARDTASAHEDFVANTHGLWSSGLASNAQRLVYQNYVDNASKIGTQRAARLADIGARQTAATGKYQAGRGALASKYAGLKNEYITSHQNSDAQAAAANAAHIQATQIAAASRAARASAPTARDYQSGANGDIMAAFQQAQGSYHPFIREQTAQAIAQAYGISLPAAQHQVNSIFTDSWDHGMQVSNGYIKKK